MTLMNSIYPKDIYRIRLFVMQQVYVYLLLARYIAVMKQMAPQTAEDNNHSPSHSATKAVIPAISKRESSVVTKQRLLDSPNKSENDEFVWSHGNIAEEIYYYPYGGTRYNNGSVNVKHKYTGQEEDGETGLYYYGARYYDPQLGRFISADTIVPEPDNPQALNRYTYVLDNPLKYVDPTGQFWESVIAAIVAVVVGYTADQAGANVDSRGGVTVSTGGNVTNNPPPPPPGPPGGSGGMNGGSSGGGGSGYGSGYANPASAALGYGYQGGYNSGYAGYGYNVRTDLSLVSAYGGSSFTGRGYGIEDLYGHRGEHYGNAYYYDRGNTAKNRRNIDWIDVTLGGVSSTAALVALGAPVPQVKLGAELIGTTSTVFTLGRTAYKWRTGEISDRDAAIKAALDVVPFFGKGAGKAVGKWFNPDAGKSIDAAVDVFEHQKGLFEVGSGLFYEPNK